MSAGPSVVVVGANLAGGRAVEALRSEGFDGRIILIGEEPHRPYERPPMSKEVLRGEWPAEKAFLRPESWYAENDIELMLGTRAQMVDLHEQTILASGSLVPYDALVLATGGSPRSLDVPGATLQGIHTLRTMDDSIALSAELTPGARVVVVGFGFIGAEVAAGARARGCEVTMLEGTPVPFGLSLGPEIGPLCADIHRDNGVRVLLAKTVERF